MSTDAIAVVDADLHRADGMSLHERFDTLFDKFARLANYNDFYLHDAGRKKASIYVILLALPLGWIVAGIALLLLRRRLRYTLDVWVIAVTAVYLLAALPMWSDYAAMMARL